MLHKLDKLIQILSAALWQSLVQRQWVSTSTAGGRLSGCHPARQRVLATELQQTSGRTNFENIVLVIYTLNYEIKYAVL
jgi:hypothetical protein